LHKGYNTRKTNSHTAYTPANPNPKPGGLKRKGLFFVTISLVEKPCAKKTMIAMVWII